MTMDNQANFLESEFEQNDAKVNLVLRRMTRPVFFYTLAHMVVIAAATWFFLFTTAISAVRVFTGTENGVSIILFGVCAVWFVHSSWRVSKGAGVLLAQSLRSDLTICKGLIEGVSYGHNVTRLHDDSIEWKMRDYDFTLHLKSLYSARAKGSCLLLRNNSAEAHYVFGTDIKSWPKLIRQRQKLLPRSGWVLPDDDSWRRYALPKDVFESGLSEIERKHTQAVSLKTLAFMVGCFILVVFAAGSNFSTDESTLQIFLRLVFLSAAVCILLADFIKFCRGFSRHRNGMSPIGQDVLGVTHGDTAAKIVADGFEIRRSHLRKTIRWAAISSVEQNGGWLSLRTSVGTLDIVPSSHEFVQALSKAGLKTPCGPWEMAQEQKTWGRAA